MVGLPHESRVAPRQAGRLSTLQPLDRAIITRLSPARAGFLFRALALSHLLASPPDANPFQGRIAPPHKTPSVQLITGSLQVPIGLHWHWCQPLLALSGFPSSRQAVARDSRTYMLYSRPGIHTVASQPCVPRVTHPTESSFSDLFVCSPETSRSGRPSQWLLCDSFHQSRTSARL